MKVAIPENVAVGVKFILPVTVLTETVPVDNGGTPETVSVAGFIGPPETLQMAHTEMGVFTPVAVFIGEAMGGVPVTLMVINALVHETGAKLHMP